MTRPLLIAGNWKMNGGPRESAELAGGIRERLGDLPDSVQVLICPPFVSIPAASVALDGSETVWLGAQDVHYEDEGAYTGEVSTSMLRELGCTHVIVGHSERREFFGESDTTVNYKLRKALGAELTPVVCVGESLQQRKKGTHQRMVGKQVEAAFTEVSADDAPGVIVAYEPLWAIGTGETATPQQAQEMHDMIRSAITDLYDLETARAVQILYGGSMKPRNARELLEQPDVDGGLVGGASLEAESFAAIVEIAEQISSD